MGLDRHLYFRNEISQNNPTGKKWVHVQASFEIEHKKQEVFKKKHILPFLSN